MRSVHGWSGSEGSSPVQILMGILVGILLCLLLANVTTFQFTSF